MFNVYELHEETIRECGLGSNRDTFNDPRLLTALISSYENIDQDWEGSGQYQDRAWAEAVVV